jgi:hypothetical protein
MRALRPYNKPYYSHVFVSTTSVCWNVRFPINCNGRRCSLHYTRVSWRITNVPRCVYTFRIATRIQTNQRRKIEPGYTGIIAKIKT